jgi:hypothetical protein
MEANHALSLCLRRELRIAVIVTLTTEEKSRKWMAEDQEQCRRKDHEGQQVLPESSLEIILHI